MLRTVYRTFLLLVVALCFAPLYDAAKARSEIENFAVDVADIIARTGAKHFLVVALQGCMLDVQVCSGADQALHSAMTRMIPGVQFASREDVLVLLEKRGFISSDVYNSNVLEVVASETGANILITEDLCWLPDGYELITRTIDVVDGKQLDESKLKVARLTQDSGENPLVIKDPDTKVSFIIPKNKQSPLLAPMYPKCEKCPQPQYSSEGSDGLEGALVILATITEQGRVEQISVLKSYSKTATMQAIGAMRSWRYKPAVGPDGVPIAVRLEIRVSLNFQSKD